MTVPDGRGILDIFHPFQYNRSNLVHFYTDTDECSDYNDRILLNNLQE